MLKLTTIAKKAAALGLDTQICKLTGGGDGLFIKLEYTDQSGKARPHPETVTRPLMRYLSRYNVPHEYRGNYTSLFIMN